MTLEHKSIPSDGVHIIHRWKVADVSGLNGLTVYPEDVDKIALREDNDTFYRLKTYSPIEWVPVQDLSQYYKNTEVEMLLLSKVNNDDERLSDARDWIAPEVTQVEAENLLSADNRKWSPLRVGEAINHWWSEKNLEVKITSLPTGSQLSSSLDEKVDKVLGKGLSDENYTSEEKTKLASLESSKFKGLYPTLAELQTTHPTSESGDYAFVDGGIGNPNELYVWDSGSWEKVSGDITTATPAQIKDLLLQNADTNNFGDSELAVLQGAASQSDLVSGLSSKADTAHIHTISNVQGLEGELSSKVVKVSGKGLSTKDFTDADKNKIDSLQSAAFTDSSDYEPAGSVSEAIGDINGLVDLINGEVI